MDRAVDDDLLYDWVARRYPDPRPVQERVRAARRRRLLMVVPLALVLGWLIFFTEWLPDDDAAGDLPAWRSIAGLVLMGVGVVVGLVMWVRIIRTPELRRAMWGARRTGLWALTGGQRRALLHQVLGKADVVEEDLPGTREVARAYVAQKPVLSLIPFSTLLLVGAALVGGDAVPTAIAVAMAGALLCVVPVLRRRTRQAEHFLAEHPAP
jgi:hypothetical protein